MRTPALLNRCVSILLLTWLAQAPFAHSAIIGLQPEMGSAGTGDSISLDLVISDLGDFGPDSLGAFDISVGFDASVLSFTSYSLGGFLGDLGLFEAIDASSGDVGGAINVAEVSLLSIIDLDALQSAEFTLATLTFDVTDLAVGASTQLFIMTDAILAKADGSSLPVSSFGSPAVIQGAASVPVPGTLLLFLGALFGWNVVRRRQTSSNSV